jgi:osmotically-inducible protein OsmY
VEDTDMKSDTDVKRDVEAELKWSPEVDETDIAVKVNGGEVTLTGYVRSFYEKFQAEVAIKRVKGVAAVANDIEVRQYAGTPTDPEIARAAVEALKVELPVTWENIKPLVHKGRITLEGTVEWQYQRLAAESAMRRLNGVMGVLNAITLRPKVVQPEVIKHNIDDAFRRIAHIDADHITVDTRGSDVTLRGEVRSWAERDEAQRTAWSAPGVANVVNEIRVRV